MLSSHLFWTSDLWTHQPGSHRRKATQDFSSTFLLRCLPSFLSREGFSYSFPSSTVKSNFVYPRTNRSPLVGKNPSYRDSNSRPNVRRFRGFQLNHRGDRLYRFVKPLFANLSYNTSSSIAIVLVVSMYRRNGCWTIFIIISTSFMT